MEAAKNVQAQSYDEQVKRAKQQSETALREAYIKNLQNQSGLDQQLRASGVTGGAAESTRSAMLNNYMKTRADLQNAAGQTIKDIELDKASALANYDLQKANADANFNATYADYIQNADNNAYNRKIQDENMEITRQQLEQDRLNTAYERALALIDSGLVDHRNIGSIADTLGLEQGTIKAYIDRLNAQAVSSSGSGGSRSGSARSSSAGSGSSAADEQSVNNEGTEMPTESEVISGVLTGDIDDSKIMMATLYGIDIDKLRNAFEEAEQQGKLEQFFNELERAGVNTTKLREQYL